MSGSVIDSNKEERSVSPDNSPVILAIDTSSHHGSIALIRGRHPLALYGADSRDTHSTRLITEIDMVLAKARIKLEELDALSVITGPGSFTGLRIGLSTIKGLARAISKPVVGVTALEATAHAAGAGRHILAFVNALRSEVYAQLFTVGSDGAVPVSKAMVAPPETVLEQFTEHNSLVLVGDGVAVYRENIESTARANGFAIRASNVSGDWSVVSDAREWTLAPEMPFLAFDAARIAVNRVLSWTVSKPQDIEAFYVRQSDAELKLGTKGQ